MSKFSAALNPAFSPSRKWIVLINRTSTMIYETTPQHSMSLVASITNPEGKSHEFDLVSDRSGRSSSSAGDSIRHSLARRSGPHEHIALKFCQHVAQMLELANNKHQFTELVLVAEPHILGLLRKELSPAIMNLVRNEIHHDYCDLPEAELHSRIRNI